MSSHAARVLPFLSPRTPRAWASVVAEPEPAASPSEPPRDSWMRPAAPPVASLEAVATLLTALREHLDLEVATVSEWDGDQKIYRFLDGAFEDFGLRAGASVPLAESYGLRIVEGTLPAVIADTRADARTRDLEMTRALGVGAYVGVPLRGFDGRVLGMLSVFGRRPQPALSPLDSRFLSAFAAAFSAELARQRDERAAERARAERVRAALEPGAFHMVFQPVVDLASRDVVGFEALARFTLEPRRGPDQWFAEAWAIERGVELELAAVTQALAALPSLPPTAYLTVNVAPRTLVDPRLAAALGGGSLARVVLEITEHAAVEDYAALDRALRPLRARGVRLAVDDVGAGFASLQHILRLRPDFIKLDLNLSRDVDLDPARRALVSALVSFGVEVGVTVLAEGIERRAEFVALRRLGVMLGQGYFIGRPAPLALVDDACVAEGERPVAPARHPRELIASITSPAWVTEEGVIVDANRAAAELFGYAPGAMVGLEELALFPPSARDTWAAHLDAPADARYETVGQRRDRSLLPIAVRERSVELRGRPVRVCAVVDGVEGPRRTRPYTPRGAVTFT